MERNTRVKKEMNYALHELAELISDLDSSSIQELFQEIFTKAELDDLSLRWLLMKKLKTGIPQRKIAEELHISLCKITRGSKLLKTPNGLSKRFVSPMS
jgi:TrpR family trp operon transcriptional repressor